MDDVVQPRKLDLARQHMGDLMKSTKRSCLGIVSAALLAASPVVAELRSAELDRLTSVTLKSMDRGDLHTASVVAAQLAQRHPDFPLGLLLHAELQSALAGRASLFSNPEQRYSPELMDLLLEAQTRLQHDDSMPLPHAVLQVGSHVRHVVYVDLHESVLYLYRVSNNQLKPQSRHYIGSGSAGYGKSVEGDLKTPLGVYTITGFRSDDSLPELYGSGALMLDYPNALDRKLGRTGSGIWLHGVPREQASRSPRSSEGCVTMGNDYLLHLRDVIEADATHVILSAGLQPAEPARQAHQRERFQELFSQYREAWAHSHLASLRALYTPLALPEALQGPADTQRVSHQTDASTDESPKSVRHPGGYTMDQLQALDPRTISMVFNPSLDGTEHLVMSFATNPSAPGHSGATTTLYWARNGSGQWHIIEEYVTSSGT